jgi:hypothetical protein
MALLRVVFTFVCQSLCGYDFMLLDLWDDMSLQQHATLARLREVSGVGWLIGCCVGVFMLVSWLGWSYGWLVGVVG